MSLLRLESVCIVLSLVACTRPGDRGPAPCVPGSEVCNGQDDDCDGWVDNNPSDGLLTFRDADGDGAGDAQYPWRVCEVEPGYADAGWGDDCDDADVSVGPFAYELCDGLDQNCNGVLDEDAIDGRLWFEDRDGDGHGNGELPVIACDAREGVSEDAQDCDDGDPTVWDDCGPPDPCEDCTGEVIPFAGKGQPVVALGDVDHDGAGDLLVENKGLRVAYGGPMFDGTPSDVRLDGRFVCAADFDGDSALDVLTNNGSTLRVFWAPFVNADFASLGSTGPGQTTQCGDFDGNGIADIALVRVPNGMPDPCQGTSLELQFWWNPGLGDFERTEAIIPGEGEGDCMGFTGYSSGRAVRDVTGDGAADLLVQRDKLWVTPDGQGEFSTAFVLAKSPFVNGVELSDLALGTDHDVTWIDRVAPAVPSETVGAFATQGNAARAWGDAFGPVCSVSGGRPGFTLFFAGDLYGDSQPDIVVSDISRTTLSVFDDPAGDLSPFDATTEIGWTFHNVTDVLSDDFDGDGIDDLVIAEDGPPGGAFVPGRSL